MAFNPLQNYMQGQQAGQGQQIQRLSGALAGEMQGGGNIQQSQNFQDLMALDPDRANKSMATFQALSKERKTALYEDMVMARTLLSRGDDGGALNIFEDRIDALGGPGEGTQDSQYYVDSIRSGNLEKTMADLGSGIEGANAIGIGKAPVQKKTGKTPQQIEREIANTERVTGLRERELEARMAENARKAIQLTPSTQKMLDRSQTSAFEAKSSSSEARLLADDYSKLVSPSGTAGKFNESMKSLLGSEDAVSDIKRRFRAIRASSVIKNLPPGAASESDVKLALSGLPSENASPESVEMFLRGMAKLSAIQYEFQTLRSTMLSEGGNTKSLLKKWEELSTSDDFMANINEMSGAMSTPQNAVNPVNKFSGFKVIRNK
tara:strand:- start:1355 stop:2488 length:1134 start_codon:yes stop_codon:yes gene_type:complete